MEYELELSRITKRIKKKEYKRVCIQLPDGLKPRAGEITDHIEKETGSHVLIWGGTCFGACDLPANLESLGVEFLVHFGHSKYEN